MNTNTHKNQSTNPHTALCLAGARLEKYFENFRNNPDKTMRDLINRLLLSGAIDDYRKAFPDPQNPPVPNLRDHLIEKWGKSWSEAYAIRLWNMHMHILTNPDFTPEASDLLSLVSTMQEALKPESPTFSEESLWGSVR